VDFLTDDGLLVDRIQCGELIEFSIGTKIRPTENQLDHVAVLPPPARGACPGTGVLDLRPAEPEFIAWSMPAPFSVVLPPRPGAPPWWRRFRRPAPVERRQDFLELYGERRDDYDPIEYWVNQAAMRDRG
jgi:hypothetical protein